MKNLLIVAGLLLAPITTFAMHSDEHISNFNEDSNPRLPNATLSTREKMKTYQVKTDEHIYQLFGKEENFAKMRNNLVPIIHVIEPGEELYFYAAPNGACWSFKQFFEEIPELVQFLIESNNYTIKRNLVTSIIISDIAVYYIADDNGTRYCFKELDSRRDAPTI